MPCSQEQPLESSLCDPVRLAARLLTCTSLTGLRTCSTNTPSTPRAQGLCTCVPPHPLPQPTLPQHAICLVAAQPSDTGTLT